ncbi:MAG: TOBE domain-containing protein [Chloroflexota bacterium]|nr:TOBE domain-containing protein [Chloroflexota bacterium]
MLPLANGLLIVGLRPEVILLSLVPASGSHSVPVVVSEPLGSEVIVNVTLGTELVKIRTAPEVRPEPNQLVYIAAEPSGIRLFDADSGEAVDR